jgi:hypothetical protein
MAKFGKFNNVYVFWNFQATVIILNCSLWFELLYLQFTTSVSRREFSPCVSIGNKRFLSTPVLVLLLLKEHAYCRKPVTVVMTWISNNGVVSNRAVSIAI